LCQITQRTCDPPTRRTHLREKTSGKC
jgi:hypothetical protein